MKEIWVGLALTVVVTAALMLGFGEAALVPGLVFGALATLIQFFAVVALKPVLKAPLKHMMVRWGLGMGLRFVGVVLFAVAVLTRPDIFPPLPTAFAYIGVVIPLLFLEIRLLR